MAPTYETTPKFNRAYARLTKAQQAVFKEAVGKFVQDIKERRGYRKTLRIKKYQGEEGVFELSWAGNGRALFKFGSSILEGEPHVLWLNIGGHEIF